jgi:hypothetical protein
MDILEEEDDINDFRKIYRKKGYENGKFSRKFHEFNDVCENGKEIKYFKELIPSINKSMRNTFRKRNARKNNKINEDEMEEKEDYELKGIRGDSLNVSIPNEMSSIKVCLVFELSCLFFFSETDVWEISFIGKSIFTAFTISNLTAVII